MNRDEAKNILLLYRSGADAEDPQIAKALVLAKGDTELAHWFEEHCARQNALREKFRQISAPAGLKEQIISEQAVQVKVIFLRRNFVFAAAAIVLALAVLSPFLFQQGEKDDGKFSIYQYRMAGLALRGYNMDLTTNDAAQIRIYLSQNHAPSDYVLPATLQKADAVGCAVENWQDKKVSMICFRTGRPLEPGAQSDLWLFVVDRASVKDAPSGDLPQFAKVNQLTTATWMKDGKLYLLGAAGDESLLRKFL